MPAYDELQPERCVIDGQPTKAGQSCDGVEVTPGVVLDACIVCTRYVSRYVSKVQAAPPTAPPTEGVHQPRPLSEATGRAILEEAKAIRALLEAGAVFDVGQPIGKERA